MSIMAREVIEGYEDTNGHPVGTGAYLLTRWTRASHMTLEANPNYRGYTWNFEPSADAGDKEIIAAMKGKTMPQIGVIEVSVIEEEQSRWLAFQNGELDIAQLPWTFAPVAMPGGRLAPDLTARGVRVSEMVDPEITYTYFNMRDPLIGGFSKEKIALRRAIAMAYDSATEVRVVRNNNAVEAQSPIPVGIVGHDPAYRNSIPHNVDFANKLLDKFGYRRGADGYRTLPDGSLLTLKRWSRTGDSEARELDELWTRSLERIGVRVEIVRTKFSDLIRAGKECQPMMANAAWIADYPDADNFMQLLYSPHIGQSNYACYHSPEYDHLYQQSRRLPDSPERNRLFRKMSRLVEMDTPWRIGVSRMRTMMVQPRIVGYKKHPILHQEWLYLDIERRK
jgi:oligopeptide transport system substrate-binding protein